MTTLQRQQRFAKDHESYDGQELSRAIFAVIFQNGGLAYLTETQRADVMTELVRNERRSHHALIRSRKSAGYYRNGAK